jgi:hypothetical protein
MIENIQHEYFIWEEKNSTEQKTKLENNGVKEEVISTNEIKNDSTQKDWKDITDPKLRKKMRDKAYYLANKSKIKERSNFYYNLNKDKKLTYQKNYSKKNKQKIKTYKKHYRVVNKDKLKIKKNVYYKNNKDKIKIKKSNYYQFTKDERKKYNYNKLKTDIQYKLRSNLRSRLNRAITNGYKAGSAVKDLGCSIDEFKIYLESKFLPGMSWDNWSRDGWHIDHIKPLSSFDLKSREQLLEACHYTNLQPLWAEENLSKGKN